jgi:hypothetical protein
MTKIMSGMDERDERKPTFRLGIETLKNDIKTGVPPLSRDEHGRNLLTGHAVSGV